MSNGYELVMTVFNKISKVPFGHLRSLGHNSVVHVDDSNTIKLLRKLGFIIHTEKSVLVSSQTIGFII